MTALDVEVVTDIEALLAIAGEWDELVSRARVDHPFLCHDWVRSWWECFGGDKQLYVIAVRAGTQLVAIAPLMRTQTRIYGLPVRRLEFIANVHTPRFDIIVAERADEVYAAILDHLAAAGARWDIMMLPELSETSRTDPALRRLADARSMRSAVWVAGASPRIALSGKFEDYCAGLASRHRTAMRRRMRNLERLGKVTMEIVSADAEVATALEEGFRIEAGSWKGAAGTAIALHADLTRFYALVAERAARAGRLCLLFLKVDNKRIAFAYCLRHERTLYVLKNAYDPAYKQHSPFNALLWLAIEAAFREGLEAIDLLGSEEPWKLAWTDKRLERRWLFLHRNSFRALVVYYLKFVIVPRLRRRAGLRALPSGEPDAESAAPNLARAEP